MAARLVYCRAGRCLLRGEDEFAISLYKIGAEIDSENVKAYHSLASAYELNGQYDLAISEYNKSVAIDHTLRKFADTWRNESLFDFSCSYLYRGKAYQDKGEFGQAIADYGIAIRQGGIEVRKEAEASLRSIVNRSKSKREIKDALIVSSYEPGIPCPPKTHCGIQLIRLPFIICVALTRAIVTLPLHIWGMFLWIATQRRYKKAISYHNRGQFDLAVAEYESAFQRDLEHLLFCNPSRRIATDPTLLGFSTIRSSGNFDGLAYCYVRRGLSYVGIREYERAQEDFEVALDIDRTIGMHWIVEECRRIAGQQRTDANCEHPQTCEVPRLEELARDAFAAHKR